VRIAVQHLWMCRRHHLAYSTPITSGVVGRWTSTPTGHYVIQGVQRDTTLTLISGDTYAVKYWIPFDGPLFGFHDSSWQDFPYGSSTYRTRGSHGCIHMPLKAIAFLARWAQVGAAVTIS
jgi:lipoprotein-anchoring transpeptidase ErfK/SrfK